jgi:hypothetical protein
MSEIDTDKWWKDRKDNMIKNSIKNGEFFRMDAIYCPYCGHEQRDAFECLPRNVDDEEDCDCEKCDKVFSLSYECVYTTKVKK